MLLNHLKPLTQTILSNGVIHKIGRRKMRFARVYVSKEQEKSRQTKREFTNYFPNCNFTVQSNATLAMTENASNFDVKVNVYGGGSTGQAEAVRMAIAAQCVR